jgi:hypothetical protein
MSAHSPDQWTLVILSAPTAVALALTYKPVRKAPPASRVAVSLETRRLGDYLWWPGEAMMAAIIAASWVLLLIRGDARVEWIAPVVFIYAFVGMLLFEIRNVRRGFPLPVDRSEEHRQWMEAGRHHGIRVCRISRWFLVTMLGAYALLHDPEVSAARPWLFRLFVGLAFVWLAAYVVTMVRGTFWMISGAKRGLVSRRSWSAPFRKSRWMSRGWVILIAAWFAGLILLIAISLN